MKTFSSKYRGVYFEKFSGRWRALIQVNNQKKFLGRYCNELHAAVAYDLASVEYHQELADPNFNDDPLVHQELLDYLLS